MLGLIIGALEIELKSKLQPLPLRGFNNNPGSRCGLGTRVVKIHGPVVLLHVGHAILNFVLFLFPLGWIMSQEIIQGLTFD